MRGAGHQDADIADVFQKAKTFFYDRFRNEIFKGTTTVAQLVKQSEIDVLGVRIGGGLVEEVIGADVAFHTGGLLYGKKEETASRITKKILRTAMVLRSVFPEVTSKIIFTTPKINPANLDLIVQSFDALEEYFQIISWPVDCELICNDDFEAKILKPTIELGRQVADTSELFLRSYQLLSMFKKKEERRVVIRSNESSVSPTLKLESRTPDSGGGDRPIRLIPSPASKFKQAFLEKGVATITIHHLDGRVENKEWHKNRFTIESNVMGNLRSRAEFRIDAWNKNQIKEVIVTVSGYGDLPTV